MCGIVGYVGKEKAYKILLEGLKRLEYRGYDSAGLATIFNNKITIIKRKGEVDKLSEIVNKTPPNGIIGIAHTRWATHGIPSDNNSHPHSDCANRLVIVHNGIIENFSELKERLINNGHRFTSDTDTEVVAHLIEEYSNGNNLEEAIIKALKEITGSYALGIISSSTPDRIIAARCGSPLVIGLGNGENFIASDIPAIMRYTKNVIFLDDNEIAIVKKDNVNILNLDKEELTKKVAQIKWKVEEAEKGGYSHFMLKEINEQPEVIKNTLMGRLKKDKLVELKELDKYKQFLKNMNRIFIVACGTAYYAGLTGKYILEEKLNLPIEVDLGSEFRYRQPKVDSNSLIIAISQSGETADTLASVREAKRKGGKILSICNVVGSTLTRESDMVLYTYAGPEICVASTKAYVAQLVVIYLLTCYLGKLRGEMQDDEIKELINELITIPDKLKKILENENMIIGCAKKYYKLNSFLYLARGINYPNALEGALKLKEISYKHAEGYAAGEMKHGPIALVEEQMASVFIIPKCKVYDKLINNIEEVKARGGIIITIATDGDEKVARFSDYVIYIPKIPEFLSPLLVVVPLQLLAYYIAKLNNREIDKPRNLAKSVTVE